MRRVGTLTSGGRRRSMASASTRGIASCGHDSRAALSASTTMPSSVIPKTQQNAFSHVLGRLEQQLDAFPANSRVEMRGIAQR